MTLVELMVSMAVMLIVISGAFVFLVAQVRMQRRAFLRASNDTGGQAALSLLTREIGNAGLGLPARLAIKEVVNDGDPCHSKIAVAWLDLARQWTAASTTIGGLTLAAAAPLPGNALAPDIAIPIDSWLFIHRNGGVGLVASGDHGHGMALVTGTRAAGAMGIAVHTINAFSGAQPVLDLATTSVINSSTTDSRPIAVLVANVSTFGIDCSIPNQPYLYYERAGGMRAPLASVATALSFAFLVDVDRDGVTDPTPVTDPSVLDPSSVVAVDLSFSLRSLEKDPDPKNNVYLTQDYHKVVNTTNIRPTATTYIFVDNSAI